MRWCGDGGNGRARADGTPRGGGRRGHEPWGAARANRTPGKRSTFDALLDAGVTLFDTAEIYTAGASERTIGRCIQASRALTPTVLSKFFPYPWRLRKRAMNAALGRSLSRLQVPRVDVYLLHFPWPPVSVETWADALADEVKAGLARAVGISNCSPAQTRRRARGAVPRAASRWPATRWSTTSCNRRPERSGLAARLPGARRHPHCLPPAGPGRAHGKYTADRPPRGLRADASTTGRPGQDRASAGCREAHREGPRKDPAQVAHQLAACKRRAADPRGKERRTRRRRTPAPWAGA